MPADIVIHDNKVEVIDGPLVLRDGNDQGVISATRISSIPEVSTGELRAEDCHVQAMEVGTGSPREPRAPGSVEVKDRQGEVTLKIDGQKGSIQLRKDGKTAYLGPDRISSVDRVLTRKLQSNEVEADQLEVGVGSPSEPAEAGEIQLNDSRGEETLRLDGATGSLHFANGTEPMLYVLSSGTSNPDRPVIAHSPRFDTWGLTYRDRGDKFIFQRAGDGVMTVGLGEQQVGIRTEDPDFTLHVNGQVAGVGAFNGLSDARCKEGVEPLHSALDAVRRLRGVRFEWKEGECGGRETPEGPQLGFLAQEVEEVLPEVVTTGRSGYRSVAYGSVVPVLVEAIKEQQEELEQAREERRALEDRLASLEARLSAMEETTAVVG